MCRVEERVYVDDHGRRQAFEESFPCEHARRGRLCSNVRRKTTEYRSGPHQIPRDDTSSPASYNPPTPNGSNTILVQPRASSRTERRPSTSDGTRRIKPEIIIQIGGTKKDKGKKYPAPSSRSYKRSSLGASSVGSDIAVESPGSEASYTLRTGFPETPVPPPEIPGYTTRPAVPQRHRHTSSGSSFTLSSQAPTPYATSDAESPSNRRAPRYPPTIVHNPPTGLPTIPQAPPSPYRTTIVMPRDSSERVGADGLFPVDYSEFQGLAESSHASSGRAAAPEITDRDEERARLRKARADADKKRREKADHEMAKAIQEEETKQVRFELGRADARAKERAENQYAQHEKQRAEEREEARRMRQEQKERESKEREESIRRIDQEQKDRAAKEAREEADRLREKVEREVREAEANSREKRRESRPPTRDFMKRSRRRFMSQHDIMERDRLLAETKAQMALEREAAERREREEQAAHLLQQQQQPQYWDPRGGSRVPLATENPGVGRRNSVSGRRGSISMAPPQLPPLGIGRSNSQRRVSIIQPAPPANLPPINTSFQTPLLSPGSAQPSSYARPPSARHSSYDKENPFAQPFARTSNTSQDNPFAGAGAPLDPWDARDMRDALPRASAPAHGRQPPDEHRPQQSLRRRGEEVIERAAAASRPHDRARQATRTMGKVVGFEGDYEDDHGDFEEGRHGEYKSHRSSKKDGKRRS